MTKEEIQKHIDDSRRALQDAHDELADTVRDELKKFRKKTLDHT